MSNALWCSRKNKAIKEDLALCDELIACEQAEYERLREIGVESARMYRKVVNSRLIKVWLNARRKMGRPFRVCKASFPARQGKRYFESQLLDLHDAYLEAIAPICDSNGSSYYQKAGIKIGIIADEFNYRMYSDALDAIYISPLNYHEVIGSGSIQALFVMSSWHGLGHFFDIDQPEFTHYFDEAGLQRIETIVGYAKSCGVKTIFQSTEDPVDFDRYKAIAKTCDYVFTSSSDMIPRYCEMRGDASVFEFQYAINPLIHNPIGLFASDEFDSTVFFAGAYYPKKFVERNVAQEMIFGGVIDSGHPLSIADRNDGRRNIYPSKLKNHVMPSFSYDDLQKVHKLFDYSINLNSVTTSPTMCARRTYEVQALGGLMLSNYSLAVSNQFPEIPIVLEESEVGRILSGHTAGEVINMQLDGIRRMFSSCTVYDRLNRVFDLCGIDFRFPERAVYVLWEGDPAEGEAALASQSLVGARLVPVSRAGELEGADGFAILWDGSGGRDYLLDMVNAFKFVDVDYVRYVELGQDGSYDYVEGGAPARNAMFDLSRVPAADVASGCAAATSGFGVVEPLPPRPVPSGPKRLGVVVPVYNNGRYLEGRCFRSLLRSSAFGDMRVYLVDDGSTDPATVEVVERLSASYPNVEAYFFGDGGSGSASRPRNKGIEMCSEPYVTFLDPDNEAINDGYALLMSELEDDASCDFAFGPILKVDGRGGRAKTLRFTKGDVTFDHPRSALIDARFEAQSMQACVFRREYLARENLALVEGAVGEDTLFSYEMMSRANRMRHVDTPIHVYYADRGGSEVNTIGVSFFRKSLALEREQVKSLLQDGLMDEYMLLRYADFMSGWYQVKLAQVDPSDIAECGALVNEIADLYRVAHQ